MRTDSITPLQTVFDIVNDPQSSRWDPLPGAEVVMERAWGGVTQPIAEDGDFASRALASRVTVHRMRSLNAWRWRLPM